MKPRSLVTALLVVALALAAGATGCSRRDSAAPDAPPATETTAPADGSGVATESAGGTDAAGAAAGSSSVPTDASSIIRELDAIERELGGMDLPSETDFDSLESEVR